MPPNHTALKMPTGLVIDAAPLWRPRVAVCTAPGTGSALPIDSIPSRHFKPDLNAGTLASGCRDWQQGSTTMHSNALGFASILAGGLTLLPLLVEPDPPAARAPAPSQHVLSAGDAGPICAPPPADRAGADDLSPPRRCSPIGERLAKAAIP